MRQLARLSLAATAIACAVICCIGPALASAAKPWYVSGKFSGSYSNDVAWNLCTTISSNGTWRENLNLDVKISKSFPSFTKNGVIRVFMKMPPGGSWSANGTFEPLGITDCAGSKSFQCSGGIVFANDEDKGLAGLKFTPRGKTMLGNFTGPYFVESAFNTDVCSRELGSSSVGGPLFGLAKAKIEENALLINKDVKDSFKVPKSKFKGRKPFTITRTAPPDSSACQFYVVCNQSGSLTLTLNFTHSRR